MTKKDKVTSQPFNRDVPHPLTEQEREDRSKQLADAIAEEEKLRLDKKEYLSEFRRDLKDVKERLHNLAEAVRTGEEVRSTPCEKTFTWSKKQVVVRTIEGHRVIEDRAMTPEEVEDLSQTAFV